MTYRYETRTAQGQRCCAGHTADFPRCQQCKGATSHTEPDTCRTCGGHVHTAAADEDFTPPNPYTTGIEKLRQEDAARRKTAYVPRPATMPLDRHGIPDPYFNDLQKLRSTR